MLSPCLREKVLNGVYGAAQSRVDKPVMSGALRSCTRPLSIAFAVGQREAPAEDDLEGIGGARGHPSFAVPSGDVPGGAGSMFFMFTVNDAKSSHILSRRWVHRVLWAKHAGRSRNWANEQTPLRVDQRGYGHRRHR